MPLRSGARVTAAAVVASAFLATPGRADAESDARPRNTLTTNPVRFALLHFQVDYERAVAARWSVFVAPIGFYHDTWYPFAHAEHTTSFGYGVDFGTRLYFRRAPAGFYVGPMFALYRGSVSIRGEERLTGYVASAGAQGGYAHFFGRWVLAAGLGLTYGFASERAPEGSPRAAELPHWGTWVNFRANVGLAF
jgi:hypothetical protein